MKEIRKQEEEEKKQDYMEEVMDVTKQKDMSGFYKYENFSNKKKIEKITEKIKFSKKK